jgi:hypothetical protein
MSWLDDKAWADFYMPEIKRILGLYLIGDANEDEDAQRNTDLIVLTMAAVRIGCRLRKPGFAAKYGDEFTIRCSRPQGNKTELAKIIEGWGDYFFYGHAGEDGFLAAWALCDFKPFRLWFNSYIVNHGGQVPGILKSNVDGSSEFRAFKFSELPPEFIVAQKTA